LKNYKNFLLEHKNNILSNWFYYSELPNIFSDDFVTEISGQTNCENENAFCVILGDNSPIKKLNISATIITSSAIPHNYINNHNNYFIIEINNSNFKNNIFNDNDILRLAILKKSCKKPNPRQNHGFKFEIELCKKFNKYSDSNFKLLKNIDKWDAKGKIPDDYISNIKLNGKINISNIFSENYNWNIKTVKSGNTISMGDFLRISGLEKVNDFKTKLKNKKTNEKLELIQKAKNGDTNEFMFCCKSYIADEYIIDFMVIEYKYWEQHINNNDDILTIINNIYNELHNHRINAEIIVKDFFKKDLNNIQNITGKDKNDIAVNIDKSTEKYKTKINDVLDGLLKNEEWTIEFNDKKYNDTSKTKNRDTYIDWRKKKDEEWTKFTTTNKEKFHNSIIDNSMTNKSNETNHIKLAFKRDSKGALRLQGSLSNTLFNEMKKEMKKKNRLLSIKKGEDEDKNIIDDNINCMNFKET
jgi:hypothetical protein